jgi:arylsulfatase A-like enzyme
MPRVLIGIRHGIGLGMLAGCMELVSLAASMRLPLSVLDFCALGVACLLSMGALGAACAAAGGVFTLMHEGPAGMARQLGVAGGLLCGYYLWQAGYVLYGEERALGALAMSFMPFGFMGVVFYNAKYWLRREERVGAPKLGWLAAVSLFSLAVVLVAGVGYQFRSTGGGDWALEGDKSVVLISIDTLRRDHVGVLAGVDMGTPNMDNLGAEGVVFADAVTPMPETRPAHATLLTGLHPLRHKVLSNGQTLTRGAHSLAEVLADEGYATGAFVSSYALDASGGLTQGFLVYDDDFSPVPGALRVNVLNNLARAWMVLGNPASTEWMYERSATSTVGRFETWLDGHSDLPFFAMVHLMEPHAPYDGPIDMRGNMAGPFKGDEAKGLRDQYKSEVQAADAAVGAIIDALASHGLLDDTLVVLVSDHGEELGEHQGYFGHLGLSEEAVRIPLIFRGPGFRDGKRVEQQVRLMDVPATILAWLEFGNQESEGLDLTGYTDGRRKISAVVTLVGHSKRSLADSALIGVRNSEVKYIKDLPSGREQVYDLTEDRSEDIDVSGDQPKTLAKARSIAAPDAAALERQAGAVVGEADALLKALGYVD